MDDRFAPRFKNAVVNVINHRETNFIVTSLIAIATSYVFLVSIFDRNLFHPLSPIPSDDTAPLLHRPFTHNIPANSANTNFSNQRPENRTSDLATDAGDSAGDFYITAFFSLFILWTCALVAGQVFHYLCLPPLLGQMLVGVMFGNVTFLKTILTIPSVWDDFLRRMAFILILVRCALGLDQDALRRSFFICGNLGMISTTFEVLFIVLASHFLYAIPLSAAILFGFVLASTSPAVTVPTMIRLQSEDRGTEKGIPTVVLASATIDNIYCITAFSAISSVVFTQADSISYTLTRIPVELLISAILGILAGLALRSFPRNDASFAHFIRALLIFTVSMAFYYGTRAIKCDVGGPIAVILMCIVATMRWKIDNHRRTRPEERAFRIVWNLFCQPFLFALIGLLLNFSLFTWDLVGNALAIIAIGVAARVFIVFLISLCTNLNAKEKTFLSFTFLPKATVQAALAPVLYQFCVEAYPEGSSCTFLILQTCILSILLTAPLGQFIIYVLGRTMLSKKLLPSASPSMRIDPYQTVMPVGKMTGALGPGFTPAIKQTSPKTFLMSDRDNRLRLELTPDGEVENHRTFATVHTPSFHQDANVNHQAYAIFRERQIANGPTNDYQSPEDDSPVSEHRNNTKF